MAGEQRSTIVEQIHLTSADPTAFPAATWSVTAEADNAAATATKAGVAGQSHYITSISGSFSAALIKAMTLKDGATTIRKDYVHNHLELTFARPIKLTAGAAAELSLAASGAGGSLGSVTLHGYTA